MNRTTLPALPSEARTVTAASVASLTASDIVNMSGPALAAAFNALTGEAVKRFATPADGRKRLTIAIAKARGAAPKAGVDAVAKNQKNLADTPRQTAALQAAAARDHRLAALNGEKAAPVARPAKAAAVGTRTKYSRTAVIKLLVKENPCHKGTGHYTRFALYRDGMTVAEYIAKGGKIGDVYRWDVPHGFISVS